MFDKYLSQVSLSKLGRYILLFVLLAIVLFTGFINPRFFNPNNLFNILLQVSVLGVVAMGATVLLISAGLDLSVGGMLSVSGYVSGIVIGMTGSTTLGIFTALLVATAIGMFNGLLVATDRAHPFIITLGMMTLLQGIAIAISRGSPINTMGNLFALIGIRKVGGVIPLPVIIFLAVTILVAFFLRKTPLGRYAYAIGGNEEASRLSGVRTKQVKIALYTLNGFLVGIAAVLLSSILDSALPNMGNGYELRAIAAVVIGGTPLFGGRGSVWGTLGGVLLLGLVSNSINMLGISANFQDVVLGIIILFAVMSQKY
ncbi:MAG: ABC transporter permease [Candidatus Acetothermia bacterium]